MDVRGGCKYFKRDRLCFLWEGQCLHVSVVVGVPLKNYVDLPMTKKRKVKTTKGIKLAVDGFHISVYGTRS